jgi:hypothetical protein
MADVDDGNKPAGPIANYQMEALTLRILQLGMYHGML